MSNVIQLQPKTRTFAAVERYPELIEEFHKVPHEVWALGMALVLMVRERGQPFHDDSAEARALDIRPSILKRRKAAYPEFFSLINNVATLGIYRVRNAVLFKKSAKTPIKSTTGPTDSKILEERERGTKKTPQESFLSTSRAGTDSISAVGSAPALEEKKEERLLSDEERAEVHERLRQLVAKLRMQQDTEPDGEPRRPRPHYVVDEVPESLSTPPDLVNPNGHDRNPSAAHIYRNGHDLSC